MHFFDADLRGLDADGRRFLRARLVISFHQTVAGHLKICGNQILNLRNLRQKNLPKLSSEPRGSLIDARDGFPRSAENHPSATYLAVDLGSVSLTFTVNLPLRIAACLSATAFLMLAGTLASNVPSGESSEPLCFIIE